MQQDKTNRMSAQLPEYSREALEDLFVFGVHHDKKEQSAPLGDKEEHPLDKTAADEVFDTERELIISEALAKTTYHVADVETIFRRLEGQLNAEDEAVILRAVALAARRADRHMGIHNVTYKPNGKREVARRLKQMEKRNAR